MALEDAETQQNYSEALARAQHHYAEAHRLTDEALRNQGPLQQRELAMQAAAAHAQLALVVVTAPIVVEEAASLTDYSPTEKEGGDQ